MFVSANVPLFSVRFFFCRFFPLPKWRSEAIRRRSKWCHLRDVENVPFSFFFFYAKSFRRARTGTKSFNAAYVRAKLCNCGVCAGKRIVSSEKRAMLLHPFSGYTPAKSDIFDFRNARPWDPCFVEWSHFISGNQEFVLHPNQATRTRWRMLFGLISHWFLSRWCNVLLCVQRRIKTHRKQMCEKRAGWKKKK